MSSNKHKGEVQRVDDARVTHPENYHVTKIHGEPTSGGQGSVQKIGDGRVTHTENYHVEKIGDNKSKDKK